MSYFDADYADPELDDLRAEVAAERRYHNAYLAHPDCRDPDHPGCPTCGEEPDDE